MQARTVPGAAFALLTALTLAACASAGGGAPTVPDVSGVWLGGVTVEGQVIEGTLDLTQEGSALEARFTAPAFGITAEGEGTVGVDGAVEIDLGYYMECAGSALMRGQLSADGTALSGTLQATDCTGQMVGAFDFAR